MDKVRDQFETNVFGLVRLCQLVLPGMRRQRWGKIVNLSSMGGRLVFPGGGFYHATKYAVEAISDALRFEVKGFGVDVILIEPGLIRTAFGETASGGVAEASPGEGDYAQFNAHVARATESVYEKGSPVGRLGGPPEAVAKVIEKALARAAPARPLHRHPVGEAADRPARAAARPRLGRRDALPVPPAGQMSDVERLAERAAREGRFGIDTEFMPEGRYRPLLCLVQVCVGGEIAVLDPFEGFDPAPFAEVLADPGVQVVLHAGRQDVAIMRREWRCEVTNVFDTQVAAGFAGFAAQAGYTGLLHDVLKIRVAKTASFTRWDARPLTQEQLSYAREDVEHLLPLADEIQKRLLSTGRLEWAREECRAIAASSDERDPEEVWRRLPRATGLDPRERAVARELGAWRERTAMREDRPVGSIVRDPTLVELAKRQPAGRRELGQIRGLNPEVVRRRSADLLEAIERGQAAPPIRLEEAERLQTESVDGPAIALSEALVRARAQEAGLAYELIAARADLTPIVVAARRGDPEPDGAHAHGLAARARGRRAARAAARAPPPRHRRGRSRGDRVATLYPEAVRFRCMKRGQLLLALFAALAVGAVAWFAGGGGDKEETLRLQVGQRRAGARRTRSGSPSPTRRRRRSCSSR